MSVRRIFHWTCDFCEGPPSEDMNEEPGLPDGWISTIGGIRDGDITPSKHACNNCRNKVDRKFWHPRWLDKYPEKVHVALQRK